MKFVLIVLALTLSGCSLFQKDTQELVISSKPIKHVPLQLPDVDIYHSREVEWVIITPENYSDVIKDIKRRGSSSLFAVTSQGYENLSLNQADILKLIKQQKDIIDAYKLYYKADDADKEELNDANWKELLDEPNIETPDDEIPEIE